jgi:filamentous hemagglutinin family protein
LFAIVTAPICLAQIKTDTSLGKSPRAFTGASIEITAKHGKQSGANLLHSFSDFNINTGQSVTFTGRDSVRNVLSRVTGGRASNIDGLLRCAIPNANFYLMNPAGVIFGPNAKLDVKGSFAVTTADYLASSDGTRFSAVLKEPVLITDAPAAFGFVTSQRNSIKIRGSTLAVAQGKALSVIGGDGVEIVGAGKGLKGYLGGVLSAPAGRINLISVGDAGEVQLDAADLSRSPKVRGFATLGNISLSDHAFVNVDGEGGGLVSVRANNLTLATSSMSAQTLGAGTGKGFDIDVRDSFFLTGKSSLITDTSGTGHGGDINVTAGSRVSLQAHGTVDPDFFGLLANTTGVVDGGKTPGGTGGDIHVTTKSLLITDAGSIRAETRGEGGNGGSIFIDTGDLTINGIKNPYLTGISVRTQPSKEANKSPKSLTLFNPGRSGDIHINADTIALYGGGRILAETGEPGAVGRGGSGTGGNIRIVADSLLVEGYKKSDGTPSGIRAMAFRKTTGNAGDVTVETGTLSLRSGGLISADTRGAGSGGVVSINAQSIDVDGIVSVTDASNVITPVISQISAKTTISSGRGGSIVVDTSTLHLSNGAIITTSTGDGSTGEGGRIDVNASQITIDSGASLQAKTGVDSTGNGGGITLGSLSRTLGDLTLNFGTISALTSGGGNAGNVVVQANNLSISNGGAILADTTATGAGGFIAIDAKSISLSGHHYTPGIGKFRSQISASTAAADGGRGGNVFVDTSSLRLTKRAMIAASSADGSGGQCGEIEINADGITLKTGASIRAATGLDSTGQGGAILIGTPSRHVQDLVLNGASVVASTAGSGNGGRITIYAKSLTELSGGTISAESGGRGGLAGKITLKIDHQMRLASSAIRTSSLNGDGGDITIEMTSSNGSIDASNSDITTAAGANGGNITLLNVYRVRVDHGNVTTQSGGGGGNINIDPAFVILNNSQINASAIEEDGGNITVEANHFLQSLDSPIDASSQKALPGTIAVSPPELNLAGNLVDLDTTFDDVAARLQEDCTKRIPPFSNFIVDGRGSIPIEPGLPQPSQVIRVPSTQPAK